MKCDAYSRVQINDPPDREGSGFPLNVGKFLAGFMVSHPRQQYSPTLLTVGSPNLLSFDTLDDIGQVTYRYTHK